MTRENKLALVLGFGLMLFVGILVSDHLAARQAPPLATSLAQRNEVGVPPLPPPGGERGGIVMQINGEVRELPAGGEDSTSAGNQPAAPSGTGVVVQAPQLPKPPSSTPTSHPGDTQTAAAAAKSYTIREGDTFAAIAKTEYGKRSLGEQLAKFNGLNPSKLKVGATIKLPAITELDPTATAVAANDPAPGAPTASSKYRMYKVREGDNLYRIAERELGAAGRWQELQSVNSDLLKGSDQLTPGTQIKIPVEGRNSSA